MSRLWTLVVCVAALGACGKTPSEVDSKAESCIAAHPATSPSDFESRLGDCNVADPEGGSPTVPCRGDAPSEVAVACEADGHFCDADAFISRAAAECIAKASDFAAGSTPWQLVLSYWPALQAPVWSVSNTTSDEGASCEQGESLLVHAETGAVLDTQEWTLSCR